MPLDITVQYICDISLRNNTVLRHNLYKANYDKIITKLSKFDWEKEFAQLTSVNDMLLLFYTELNAIIDEYVPKTSGVKRKYPPWFNKQLIDLTKEKISYFINLEFIKIP